MVTINMQKCVVAIGTENLIAELFRRGVPPTYVAEQMAFLSECRDADSLRAEMVSKIKAEAE